MGKFVVLMAVVFALVTGGAAQAYERGHRELAEKVLKMDGGVDFLLAVLPSALDNLAEQARLTSSDPQRDVKLILEVKGAIDTARAKKVFVDLFAARIDDRALNDVLAWLQSPVGRKIVEAENDRTGLEKNNRNEVGLFLAKLEASPPSQARIDLIRRFIKQTDAAAVTTEILSRSTVAVARGFGDKVNESEVKRSLESQKKQMITQSQRESTLLAFYTYRNVSDEEMTQHLDFMETASHKKYDRALIEAVGGSLETVYVAVGKKLAILAEQLKKEQATAFGTRNK